MNRKFFLMLIAAMAVIAIFAYALSTLPATMAFAAVQPAAPAASSAVLTAPKFSTLSDLESAYEGIYTQVNPSVVLIDVVIQSTTNLPGGQRIAPPSQSQEALGSGFMWDTQGDIVTNNHVIDGATQIQVTFVDGSSVPGKLVGADPDSDLAVIKVDVPASQLKPVQVADSTKLIVGQLAIAIGNPYGEQNTMTTGIVSAIGRSLPVGDNTQSPTAPQGPSYTIPDVIQTDAPINPGNSGGVLLNSSGQVIGVTQSIESQSGASAGIGFAIPSAIVQQVVPALIKTGHYDHPYLGISGMTLDATLAQAMGLPATQRGALVGDVTANGPAAKAGLVASTKPATVNGQQVQVGGDVIVAIEGQAVKSFDDVVAYLARNTQVGQTIKLTVLRDGKSMDLSLTLGARPAS